MQTEIKTERLRLIALTWGQLVLCLEAPEHLEEALGFRISRDNINDPVRRAIGIKRAKMSSVDATQHPWYTYWLVVVQTEAAVGGTPFGAGLAGFKGAPSGDGEVEIGYGIDPHYRSQGYITEAARALIAWAFEDPACRAVFAPVRRDNPASSRVLAKAGLHVYKETEETLYWRIENT